MWVVVDFVDEENVEVVPLTWLDIENSLCWWPTNTDKVLKLIEKLVEPRTLPYQWTQFKARPIGQKTSVLTVARRNCNSVQFSSDEQTTDSESDLKRKRKRTTERKMINTSGSSEEEDVEGNNKKSRSDTKVAMKIDKIHTSTASGGPELTPLNLDRTTSPGLSLKIPAEARSTQLEFQTAVLEKLDQIMSVQKQQQAVLDRLLQAKASTTPFPPPTTTTLQESSGLAAVIEEWPYDNIAAFKAFDATLRESKTLKQQIMSHSSDKSSDDEDVTKAFVLVEFEDGVQLVHRNWLIDEKKCYWPNPPYKSNVRYFKAVENAETPGENWIAFNMKILGSFSNLAYARQKLEPAEAVSDINTADNEDIQSRKERKRKRKLYFGPDATENIRQRKIIKSLPKCPEVDLASYPSPINLKPKSLTSFSPNTPRKPLMLPVPDLPEAPDSLEYDDVSERISEDAEFSSPRPSSSVNTNTPSDSDSDWKIQVLKDITRVKLHVRQMCSYLEKSNTVVKQEDHENVTQGEVFAHFPMASLEAFGNFENIISEQEGFKKRTVSLLARIGGNSTKEITKSILRRIMTDQLASNFSWHGVKGKKALALSPVADVLFQAVRQNKPSSDATDAQITDETKNWLRHAPERSKHRQSGPQQAKRSGIDHGKNPNDKLENA